MVPGSVAKAPFPKARVGVMLALTLVIGLVPSGSVAAATVAASANGGTAGAGSVVAGSGSAAGARTQCFEKISGSAGRLDLEQLRLVIEGSRVTGEYHWIPWGKDRRSGRLDGRLTASGKAQVRFRFMQEGQRGIAPLTILWTDQQARISWDPILPRDPSAAPPPPPVLLPKRDCAGLKLIPAP